MHAGEIALGLANVEPVIHQEQPGVQIAQAEFALPHIPRV